MTHTVRVTIYGISKPEGELYQEQLRVHKSLAGISPVDNSSGVPEHIMRSDGWRIDGEDYHLADGAIRDKLVRIELPDGVEYGRYDIVQGQKSAFPALYCPQYQSKDGRGHKVIVWTNRNPVGPTDYAHDEALIDNAIQSGITASIPTADGKREEVPVKIVEVSAYAMKPDERTKWYQKDDTSHALAEKKQKNAVPSHKKRRGAARKEEHNHGGR